MEVVTSAESLEASYGSGIRHLALEFKTGYLLSKALKKWQPPLEVGEKVCKTWLLKYKPTADITYVKSAGHLELQHGETIRGIDPEPTTANELASWLLRELHVSAEVRVCPKEGQPLWAFVPFGMDCRPQSSQ